MKTNPSLSDRLTAWLNQVRASSVIAEEPRVSRLLRAEECDVVSGAEWVHQQTTDGVYCQSLWVWRGDYTRSSDAN